MTYKVLAVWQEVRELEFDSLDEADEWARKLLADEPNAGISVNGEMFSGGWYVPTARKREAAAANIGSAA